MVFYHNILQATVWQVLQVLGLSTIQAVGLSTIQAVFTEQKLTVPEDLDPPALTPIGVGEKFGSSQDASSYSSKPTVIYCK